LGVIFGSVNLGSTKNISVQVNSNQATQQAGYIRFFLRDNSGAVLDRSTVGNTGIADGNKHDIVVTANPATNSVRTVTPLSHPGMLEWFRQPGMLSPLWVRASAYGFW
jgi:hypothetical protein